MKRFRPAWNGDKLALIYPGALKTNENCSRNHETFMAAVVFLFMSGDTNGTLKKKIHSLSSHTQRHHIFSLVVKISQSHVSL